MLRRLPSYLFILLLVLIQYPLAAQEQIRLILIQPTDTMIKGLPGMKAVPDSSPLSSLTSSLVQRSFMGESIRLYYLAQQYLVNTGVLNEIKPAYLAVTRQQGGFARKGFFLQNPDGTYRDESETQYVDLTENTISTPPGRLESVTQIYPHELMHILFKMLSPTGTEEMSSYNVNMHYFSIITDYNTAFNEGFAEHMENVSVLNEPDSTIKNGKYDDLEDLRPFLMSRIKGFKHDYAWPFRIGYYKASMAVWYQQFENYKRYVHASGDDAAFLNAHPEPGSVPDMITWRNTGIEHHLSKRKNLVQRMACEGFVSTFFTHLAMSELADIYQPPEFYSRFLEDTSIRIIPEKEFKPVENLFLKYFHVLHHYVNYDKSAKAQLMEFIDGYLVEFPGESPVILRIYKELTGENYVSDLPPPLWMLAKGYEHRTLVMDPYGSATIPFYTFDLNAAEPEDLMTINGIDRESAEKITGYRSSNGYFRSLDELKDIPGLGKSAADKLQSSKLDESYFNSIPVENLSIQALIFTPLLHLLKQGLMWFIIIGFVLITMNSKDKSPKQLIFMVLKYLTAWILFLAIGLAAVVIQGNTYLLLFIFILIYSVLTVLVLRNNKKALKRSLIVSGMMIVFLFYFIY